MKSKATKNILHSSGSKQFIPINILDPEHQIIFSRHIPFIEAVLKGWPNVQLDQINERFVTVRVRNYWAYDKDLELLIRKILESLRIYYPHGN